MTPEEKSLIEDLFARIRGNGVPNRDADAEALIGQQMSGTPGAAYALLQTVLVQDHALKAASAHIQQLEAAARTAPSSGATASLPPAQSDTASRWTRPPVDNAGPWSGAAPGYGQNSARGGGFLQGALQTAAGVAGGALLFDGIRSLLGGGGGFGGGLFGGGGGLLGGGLLGGGLLGGGGFGGPWGGQPTVIDETVVNNYDVTDPNAGTQQADTLQPDPFQPDPFQDDPQVQDAGLNDAPGSSDGIDNGSFDDGSGNDSGWA